MAYTILRTNDLPLVTIPDGVLETTHASLALPGRNYAGYGNILNTNFVHLLENFANDTPPAHPIKGQLWYDTSDNKLKVCPRDGTDVTSDWVVLTSSNALGDSHLGNLEVTNSITANTITANIDVLVGRDVIAQGNGIFNTRLYSALANVGTANIGTTETRVITTGGTNPSTTAGTLTGSWTVSGPSTGNAFNITSGNIALGTTQSIRCDHYLNSDGNPWVPSGTYTNGNVAEYLSGTSVDVPKFTGNIFPHTVQTANITTGAEGTRGNITGNWVLQGTSRLTATYSADIAERYAADGVYTVGTVVELGGDYEVTLAKAELSSDIFGVVSNTYAYLLNGGAGSDETHPPIALVGRISVRVVGPVKKGQRLVSAGNGVARAGKDEELTTFNVIGRSLVNKTDDAEGLIEAAVKIN
jgi:hypothetical protein